MDVPSNENRTKEVLDFLLSSYRAKMALQNPTENCPFDFQQFLATWKGKYPDWATLKATMKKDLEPLLQQGIFDSIIPYLAASINQSAARRDNSNTNLQDLSHLLERRDSNSGIISTELFALTPTSKSKRNPDILTKRSPDLQIGDEETCEIVIHVCDEAKNLKQDFKCVQSVLVQEMGYFSKVTVRGQKLKDMDISVHCDIAVFDWLMKWVKSKIDQDGGGEANSAAPTLESSNVIGLMVSAEFLQMPTLTSECIQFTAENIEEVILTSPNLGCLNESLTNRLSTYFDNIEMETKIARIDTNDRITSRLYTQFTMSLNEPSDLAKDEKGKTCPRGHFASTVTLFKCNTCGRLLINEVASRVPCTSMRLDCRGRLYSTHVKDLNWSLSNYIRDLKRELKSWRKVYWRLWGTVHFLPCSSCELTFPLKDFASCQFHPKLPQLQVSVLAATGEIQERDLFDSADVLVGRKDDIKTKESPPEEFINPFRRQREKKGKVEQEEDLETINCAFGVYPCCRKPGYKFYPLPSTNGCQFRDHNVSTTTAEQIMQRLTMFRDLIVVPPPKDKREEALSKKGTHFEWGSIVDLTPFKPISSSSLNLTHRYPTNRHLNPDHPSSTEESNHSNSFSDTEENNSAEVGGSHLGQSNNTSNTRPNTRSGQVVSEFWSWNSDFTTRYNQDMQREKEEKLMSDLELLLSQRVSLEPTSSAAGSSMRFGYLSRRTPKNLGGSFMKLEEKWRELQKGGGGAKGQTQTQRTATAKSAKS